MTKDEYDHLKRISEDRFRANIRLAEYLEGVELEEPKKGTRTGAQNNAIHLDCKLIADKLNEAGKDWKMVIREGGISIPVTQESVKELLWRPIQRLMFNKESTTELSKTVEIDRIHEVIMRELGEKHHIEWHDFPHDDKANLAQLGGYKTQAGSDYDPALGLEDYKGQPNF